MSIEQLYICLKTLQLEQAEAILETCTYKENAPEIFKLMMQWDAPDCWLAFLKNPHLANELNDKDIRDLLFLLDNRITQAYSEENSPALSLLNCRMAIAENDVLCRRIGYHFLLNFASDFTWASYIATPRFVTHLDFIALSKLMVRHPELPARVFQSLEWLIDNPLAPKDAERAARLLQELMARHPEQVFQAASGDPLLPRRIVYKLMDYFCMVENVANLWIERVVKTPHLLKHLREDKINELARKNPKLISAILMSLESLISHADFSKNENQVADLLGEIINDEPFITHSEIGRTFFNLGRYYYLSPEPQIDLARGNFLLSWENNHAEATAMLAILEGYTQSIPGAWRWLQTAMENLPAHLELMREAIFLVSTLVYKHFPQLASEVEQKTEAYLNPKFTGYNELESAFKALSFSSHPREEQVVEETPALLFNPTYVDNNIPSPNTILAPSPRRLASPHPIPRSPIIIFSENTSSTAPVNDPATASFSAVPKYP